MLIRADNSKLRSTGWTPKYTLDSGLRQTFEWWRAQK
jgi:nucleoside-diphosphate-sugar epimerase